MLLPLAVLVAGARSIGGRWPHHGGTSMPSKSSDQSGWRGCPASFHRRLTVARFSSFKLHSGREGEAGRPARPRVHAHARTSVARGCHLPPHAGGRARPLALPLHPLRHSLLVQAVLRRVVVPLARPQHGDGPPLCARVVRVNLGLAVLLRQHHEAEGYLWGGREGKGGMRGCVARVHACVVGSLGHALFSACRDTATTSPGAAAATPLVLSAAIKGPGSFHGPVGSPSPSCRPLRTQHCLPG